MRAGTAAAALRAVAIVIAIAAVIDPVFTVERTRPTPLVLINLSQSGPRHVLNGLRHIGADVVLRDGGDRLPCAADERCVVVADGSRDANVPADIEAPIALVTPLRTDGANIAIESAAASTDHHGAASGAIRVAIRGDGVTGRRTTVRVLDAGAVIGTTSIEWKSDAARSIEVPWWPIATGARVLRVEATTDGGDAIAFDDAVDLPVTIGDRKVPVLVFDPRPSWSSTFVRRALEDDPRFTVDHRARVAPALTAGTAAGRLDPATLDVMPLVIIGAPDALSAAEVDLLDQYVRNRGGSLILLPERAPSGAAARLFDGEWSEQLVAQPETAGPLRAGELLRPRGMGFGAAAIVPLVIATPRGQGRIVISGAMDAWRHRAADDGFDRFWTSVAAESAALGRNLRIDVDERFATPGSRARFTVRYRALTMPEKIEASAISRCGLPSQFASATQVASADHVRLWPAGTFGVFQGELPIANNAACSLEVEVNGAVATSHVAVAARPAHGVAATLAKLERAARLSGGVVTDEDNLEPIREWNRASLPVNEASPMRPMHSAWWLLPFAACLSAEWWLRRRNGLR